MTRASNRLLLAALVLLSACASKPGGPVARPAPSAPALPDQAAIDAKRRADFDRSLDVWHGAPVKELMAKLGPPTSTAVEARGRSVYVYARSGKVGGPAGPVTFSCVVRYAVVAERVTGHSIEGC